MAGALALTMPKVDSSRAGSEMSTLFGSSSPDNVLIGADFASNESEIFCALIAAENGGIFGLSVYEWLVVCHNIHDYVASVLAVEKFIAKMFNFANQFFCGIPKLASIAFIGLKGKKSMEECTQLAEDFIRKVRGENNFGVYEGGIGSVGFNAMKRRSRLPKGKLPGVHKQVLPMSNRPISDALQVHINHQSMTSCLNFNIQGSGQDMAGAVLIITRILAKRFNIPYQVAFMIHDQLIFEVSEEQKQDFLWIFQTAHMLSKSLFYQRLGVKAYPAKFMYFETVEMDTVLRKSPLKDCVTPTNKNPIPLGQVVKAKDCMPTERIIQFLENRII
jgi:DNA polymerase gamma 1